MKYVIDLPDNTHWVQWIVEDKSHIRYVDCRNVGDLTPYAELGRKAIEEEVWNFVMNTDFAWVSEVGDKPIGAYSYSEAKAKYEAWKDQKNKKDKLRVGDEIRCADGDTGVVTFIYNDTCDCIWGDGSVAEVVCKTEFEKTGRHFDEVAELMKKMKEGGK